MSSALLPAALGIAGVALWLLHAAAWDLGGRSPLLNYDSSQYALAARELADRGRLATPFALPIELSHRATPPWPLAVVQPGLVVVEAALFKLASPGGAPHAAPERRAWLALVLPFVCYLGLGVALAAAAARILGRFATALSDRDRTLTGLVIGLAFLLDPEAQHFATGGFTDLPFTLGLVLALASVALGIAPARPLAFGLLLGAAGSFRANMLWLAPLLCLAAAATAPRGGRLRVALTGYAGYLLFAAPWWAYKWIAFGSPGWDLTRFVIWDGVGGRSWTTIYDLPDPPALPSGAEAARLLASKVWVNLGPLLLAVLTGPRALWLGALIAWLATARGPRPLVVAGFATLASFGLGVLAAAISIPWLRYVFPARAALEAAGMLALWGLIERLPAPAAGPAPPARRALAVGVATLALLWGALSTARGGREARAGALERDLPGTTTLAAVAAMLEQELPPGEPVMSNLGPVLAWYTRRPVIHLAFSPADLEGCRRRLDVRHVVLVYRDPRRANPGWSAIVARPAEARRDPELNIRRARAWRSGEGFSVVWLELGPLGPRLAAR